MRSAFADVGLSLNIDGPEDHRMKFQGQSPKLPKHVSSSKTASAKNDIRQILSDIVNVFKKTRIS